MLSPKYPKKHNTPSLVPVSLKRRENKMKDWRPRIREGQVSIRRQRRLFVVVCRNGKEADAMEKSIIKTLVKEGK